MRYSSTVRYSASPGRKTGFCSFFLFRSANWRVGWVGWTYRIYEYRMIGAKRALHTHKFPKSLIVARLAKQTCMNCSFEYWGGGLNASNLSPFQVGDFRIVSLTKNLTCGLKSPPPLADSPRGGRSGWATSWGRWFFWDPMALPRRYGTVRVTSASPVSCFVFSVSHELGSSEHLHPIPMLEHQQPALAEILAL